MKKIIFCLAFILFMPVVKAGSYSIGASATNVKVGQSVTVYVKVDSAAGKFSASSNNSGVLAFSDNSSSVWIDNGSSSFKFTAQNPGSATITITPIDVAGYDGNEVTGGKSITVNVTAPTNNGGGGGTPSRTTPTTPKKVEPTKSSNTKLEEFGVKGFKISPEFSNNTNDYSLTVPFDTTSINIYTSRTSNKQTVTGNGDKEVKTGDNKFDVIVTAEDGTKRTIKLNVIVDTKPIVVKVNNQDYTLIKNKDELPKLDIEHEDTTLNFEGQDIPAYLINKIGYMLIGLKDSENNIKLYEYISYKEEEKPDEYHSFNYLKIRDMYFIYLDFPKNKIPDNYKEYKEKINDVEYTVYKLDKDSKFGLFYGINIETGKEKIYKYESSENTVQLYEKIKKEVSTNNNDKYKKLILILGGVIIFLLLLTTIGFTRKPKDNNDNNYDDSLTKKDIKKIEKDTKKESKKQKKKQKKGELDM